MKQADVAVHLDMSTRNLRELYARGVIDKTASLDEQRIQYIKHLRAQAAGRASTGPLDPAQEKAALDAARRAEIEDRLRVRRRELLPAEDFAAELSSAFKAVATALESLPDVLERDAGIDGAAVERCQAVIDRLREDLYTRLSRHDR